MKLAPSKEQRFSIDDYVICGKTGYDRYSDISYAEGIKDTVELFTQMGLLKE